MHRNLGKLLIATGRYCEAEVCYRQAIDLEPTDAHAYNGLAAALMKQERPDDAEAFCRHALALDPDCVDAYVTLGAILLRTWRLTEAEVPLRAAVAHDGAHALAHFNRGTVLQMQGRVADAEISLRRALEIDPSHTDVQWNLSTLLLADGRYEEGWLLYETRRAILQDGPVVTRPAVDFPEWRGESLERKALVVIAEQGYGDTLQFCRYLLMLARLGLKLLSVVCPSALAGLVQTVGCRRLHRVRHVARHSGP